MATQSGLVVVPGSDRAAPLYHASAVSAPLPVERFEVTVRVRRRKALASVGFAARAAPSARSYLSRKDYAATHGASQADLDAVADYARANGLVVVATSTARRSVFLSGFAVDYTRAFGADIAVFEHAGGTYRGRTGALTVPAELAPLIEGIFGIDNRPVAAPHFQVRVPPPSFGIAAHAVSQSFTPVEIALWIHI